MTPLNLISCQCVVYSFHDAVEFIFAMHNDCKSPNRSLCPDGGLSAKNVVKLDIDKLKHPKEWVSKFSDNNGHIVFHSSTHSSTTATNHSPTAISSCRDGGSSRLIS
jgi:hypothetical protein